MAGGALAAYLNFNKTETLNSDARSAAAEISKVRSRAATIEYPSACTSSLTGYLVTSATIDSKLTGISVTPLCTPAQTPGAPIKVLQNSVFSAAFSITFVVGSGYISDGQDRTLTLRSTQDTNLTKIITINRFGVIQ